MGSLMSSSYSPPYTLTPTILRAVSEISEAIGRLSVLSDTRLTPRLRRENRIRTIQASLTIENNTLTLYRWRPLFAYLPVETVIHERQEDYYRVLPEADNLAEATPFVEFILQALLDTIRGAVFTDQVSDQVARLIQALAAGEMGSSTLMNALGLSHRPTFRKNYLTPALEGGWIERTQPDSPRSPTQRYRLTDKAGRWLREQGK